jgi:uncharacterized protein (TIRG00374 family)
MKRYAKFIFALVILALLIYFLINIDFLEIYNVLQEMGTLYFSIAFISYSLTFLIFSIKSQYALKLVIKPSFWFFLKATLAGVFINTITPGAQVGGEPLRAYILKRKYKKPFAKIFGAIFADKIISTLVALFFIIFSILYLITYIPLPWWIKIIFQAFLFFVFLVFAIIPLFRLRKARSNLKNIFKKSKFITWLNPLKNNEKLKREIGKGVGDFTKSFKKAISNKKIFFWVLTFSFVYWILNYLVSYFLFLSLGFEINFILVIIVVSLGNLIGVFSPSPGGVGFIEGFMIFLYSIIGIDFATAVVVSLLSRVILYFHAIILGGASLVYVETSLE